MSYLALRDNPKLAAVSEDQKAKIVVLVDRLEAEARRAFHDSECGCKDAEDDLRNCKWAVEQTLLRYPGERPVRVVLDRGQPNAATYALKKIPGVAVTTALVSEVKAILGPDGIAA